MSTSGSASPLPRLDANSKPLRVLVVDDVNDNRLLLVKTMSQAGFEVRSASSGREALEIDQQWQPDLLLLDFKMPEMDGAEVTRELRKRRGAAVKIVILSASVLTDDRAALLSAGADDFVSKPFRDEQLLERLFPLLPEVQASPPSVAPRAEDKPSSETSEDPVKRRVRAAYSPEVRAQLSRAIAEADLDRTCALLEVAAEQDVLLVQRLKTMAQQFHYEELRGLLEDPT